MVVLKPHTLSIPFSKFYPSIFNRFGCRYFLTTPKQKQAIRFAVFSGAKSTQGMENMRPWNGWQHWRLTDLHPLVSMEETSDLSRRKSHWWISTWTERRLSWLHKPRIWQKWYIGIHVFQTYAYDIPTIYLWYRISACIHGYHKINHGMGAKSCMDILHLGHHKWSASSLSVLERAVFKLIRLGKRLLFVANNSQLWGKFSLFCFSPRQFSYRIYVQAEVVLNLVNSKWPRRSSGFSVTSHMQPCACRRSLWKHLITGCGSSRSHTV